MDDFPMMLYRSGSAILWDGLNLDTLVVADADALAAATGEGWLTAADVATVGDAPAEPAPRRRAGKAG